MFDFLAYASPGVQMTFFILGAIVIASCMANKGGGGGGKSGGGNSSQ